MAKVLAGITMSIDGYVTGPDDGPGKGLGEDGEWLHYWVFGGPWTYADHERGEPTGEDAAWLAQVTSKIGAVVGGRWTYEAAAHWGDQNPWGLPFFIVTHRLWPEGPSPLSALSKCGSICIADAVRRGKTRPDFAGCRSPSVGLEGSTSTLGTPQHRPVLISMTTRASTTTAKEPQTQCR
jgi:hypothetical protein